MTNYSLFICMYREFKFVTEINAYMVFASRRTSRPYFCEPNNVITKKISMNSLSIIQTYLYYEAVVVADLLCLTFGSASHQIVF